MQLPPSPREWSAEPSGQIPPNLSALPKLWLARKQCPWQGPRARSWWLTPARPSCPASDGTIPDIHSLPALSQRQQSEAWPQSGPCPWPWLSTAAPWCPGGQGQCWTLGWGTGSTGFDSHLQLSSPHRFHVPVQAHTVQAEQVIPKGSDLRGHGGQAEAPQPISWIQALGKGTKNQEKASSDVTQ